MNKEQLIELIQMLIAANQGDVDDNEASYSEADKAYYSGKISAYNTILDILVEGK